MQGLQRLKYHERSRAEKLQTLVKQHFAQFVTAKDTIDHIHALLKTEIGQPTGRQTRLSRLTTAIQNSRLVVGQIYNPLLDRRDKADRIKRVWTIFHP